MMLGNIRASGVRMLAAAYLRRGCNHFGVNKILKLLHRIRSG